MCVLNHKLTLTQTTKKEGYGVLCWMHSKVTLHGYSEFHIVTPLGTYFKVVSRRKMQFSE